MMEKIRIIIADDHKIFLDGLISLFSDYDNFELLATATSGEHLIELVKKFDPDIVITDISMKGINGIEATKIIAGIKPEVKVLVLSMHTSEEFVLNSVQAGACGYLPKDSPSKELIDAINIIYNEGTYFNREISEYFLKNFIRKHRQDQNIIEKDELTAREIELLKLAATGLSNKEIADKLFISIKTVEAHKNHILQKLRLKNSIELALYAVKNKLIEI